MNYRRNNLSFFAGAAALMGFCASTLGANFNYPDFSSTNNLSILQDAGVVTNVLRLTPADSLKIGAAWYGEKVACANGFTTTFNFRISNPIDSGGDGFTFSIQSAGLTATAYEYCPSNNGPGISFNTYLNPGLEPSDNFVGICSNGPIWLVQKDLTGTVNLSDGNVHTAVIEYNGSALKVVIDNFVAISNRPVSLAHVLDTNGMAWVGFGARTGGAIENHDILSWSFTSQTNAVNFPPVVVGKSITVAENGSTNIVLNASDANGDPLTYVVGNPSHGTLTGTPPNLTYTPATNYHGSDSFTFKVNDGTVDSATATNFINVIHVNHAPIANISAPASVIASNNLNATVVLDGSLSSDPDNDPLRFFWRENGVVFSTNAVVTKVLSLGIHNISLVVNDGGLVPNTNTVTVEVIPATPSTGTFPFASFTSTNGLSLVGSAALSGAVLRLTPAVSLAEGATWYIEKQSCLNGFSTKFSFQITNPGGSSGGDGISFSVQNAGLNVQSWEYGPFSNSVGVSINTFPNGGEVSDNFIGIAKNNSQWLLQRNLTNVNLSDGQIHTAQIDYDGAWMNVQLDGQLIITNFPVSLAHAVDTNGYAWVGFGARCGTAWENHDILNWSFESSTNGPVNHPPVALGKSITVLENGSTNIVLSASDPNGDPLTYIVDNPSHGTLTGTPPNLTYTPATNYHGPDSFTFKVNDGIVDSATATNLINVIHINQAPIANISAPASVIASNNLNATVVLDGSLSSDPENAPLRFSWRENGAVFSTNAVVTKVLSLGIHNISLVVNDGLISNTNTVTVEVIPATPSTGTFPFASFTSTNGLSLVGSAGLNGAALRLTPAVSLAEGAAWYIEKQSCLNGFSTKFSFQITGVGGASGGDGISFSVQNAGLNVQSWEYGPFSNSVGVSINTFPNGGEVSDNFIGIAKNNSQWLLQRNVTAINLSDGQIHTVQVDYDGLLMNVQLDGQLIITNFPVSLAHAVDTNGYAWVGFGGRCGIAWENHDILNWSFESSTNGPVNHPPVANSQSIIVGENVSTPITLSAADPDGNALTYNVNVPSHGILTGIAPNLNYTPDSNYFGADSFTFSVNDGQATSSVATVSINVQHINHAPVAQISAPSLVIASNNVNAQVVFDGSLSTDADNDSLQYSWRRGGVVFATGVTATNVLPVGAHTITLVVSDGFASGTNTVTVQVDPLTPPTGCVNYANFASTNGLSIIHDASVVTSTLRLTPALAYQAGAAWHATKQNCAGGFSTSFRFQISNPGSSYGYESGGDGISFSLQNVGTDVDSWEYGTLSNSFGISLNTFLNPGREVSGNFVGVCRNNSQWLLQRDLNGTSINLSDGQIHTAEINYNGTTLNVSIDGLTVISNFVVSLGNAVDTDGKAWVGLGARCGAVAWENHDILDWSFCPVDPSFPAITSQPANQKIAEGAAASFMVGATGLQPLTYQWSFNGGVLAGATGSSLVISNAQTADAGTYSVTISNSLGSVTSSNAILTVLTASTGDCISFNDFSATNSLSFNKDATVVSNALRLTTTAPSQVGSVWYAGKECLDRGFTSTFRFQITGMGGLSYLEPGGDGFAFCIQSQGLNADAYEYSPSNNGLGISFNTFWNPGLEPSGNFVGICSNGPNWMLQQDVNPAVLNLSDGNAHTAVVDYDGAALSVTIDNVAIISNYAVSLDHVLDTNGSAWIGFSARTGGAWENHDILSWSFCTLTNGPVNHAPVASIIVPPYSYLPGTTNLSLIAPNNDSLELVLNGSLSADADQDPLQYSWSKGTNNFATGVITTNTFAIGSHTVNLLVDDGKATGTANVSFTIITPVQAVSNLIQKVSLSVSNINLQPLLASLNAAHDAFERGSMGAGVNNLETFQNKVDQFIAPVNSALAVHLIQEAQKIINAVGGVTATSIAPVPPLPGGFASRDAALEKGVQLKFTGYPGKTYTVQASSDLVNWAAIGTAVADANGDFTFKDTGAAELSSRYYRVVAN